MKDVELVIKIPEETYVGVLEEVENEKFVQNIIYNAIANGTPLSRTGYWIPRNSFLLRYKCSACGRVSEKYNFCPNCGARMQTEIEESTSKCKHGCDLQPDCHIKDCVECVLDKIRAEIEEQKQERCFDDNDMFAYRTGLDDALYTVDKHKAENEG